MLKYCAPAFILFCILLSCKSKGKSNSAESAELIRLNEMYDSAIVHHNAALLKRLYAEDFIYTNPEGKVLTRDEQTASIVNSEINLTQGKSSEVRVKIYGKSAVLTGLFSAIGSYRGNPLTVNERYTSVWVKSDSSWQMVAEQGNVLK
jgi:ketosteroid isomerase-like protein